MRIAYIGRVSLEKLANHLDFDRSFPKMQWGFGLGAEVVLGLVARGHKITVITTHWPLQREEAYHADGCDVVILPERKFKWQMLTFHSQEVSAIRDCIRTVKPDVVFAQWTYHNAYAGLTSGYPTLVVAHDSPWRVLWTLRNAYALFHAIYAQLLVVPRLRYLSMVSPHIEDDFRRLNRYKGKAVIIPNGIEILGNEKAGMVDERCGKRDGGRGKTIVSISQAGRLKNSVALFKAWEILKPKHPDWRLLVYGQGMPQGMVTRAELDRVLSEEADLFVSPSLEESFGMVFVEAMRFGVPCIGGEKSGAVPWVIGDGGVVCDITKPQKLAECIEHVMCDAELRKKLSECGRKRVREMFDIEKVVDMYEAELKKVAGC